MTKGMNIPGTSDYETEQAALQRRREMIRALAEQGMAGPDGGKMVSGHYIAPSAFQQLAPLAKTAASMYASKGLDKDSAASTDRYQKGLAEAMTNYMDTKQGRVEEMPNHGPMQDGSAMQGTMQQQTVNADPRKAMVEALSSQYKPLQTIGMADMAAAGKADKTMSQKDWLSLSGYDKKSQVAAAMADDPTLLRGEGKSHVINGQLVREESDGSAKPTGDFGDEFENLGVVGTGPDGKPIMGQRDKRSGKISYAPGGGTTINVDAGGKGAGAFAKGAAEATVKKIEASAEAAKKAQQSYEIFSNAATQIDKVKGGTGAELILAGKKLAQQLGAPIDDSITATEQIVAALGQAVLDNSKQLGTGNGFTDKDREFLQNIVMAKIPLDEKSLRRAVDLGLAGALNTMRNHEDLINKSTKIEGADAATLDVFRVPVSRFNLDADRFDFDPKSNRITVKTSAGPGDNPAKKPASPTAPNTGKKESLQEERARLRKELGMD